MAQTTETERVTVPVAVRRPRRRSRTPYLLIAPSVAILLLAMGYPLAWQLVTSTQRFGLAQQFGKPPESVGLANYVTLFTDSYLWTVVLRSIPEPLKSDPPYDCVITGRHGAPFGSLQRPSARWVMALRMGAMCVLDGPNSHGEAPAVPFRALPSAARSASTTAARGLRASGRTSSR